MNNIEEIEFKMNELTTCGHGLCWELITVIQTWLRGLCSWSRRFNPSPCSLTLTSRFVSYFQPLWLGHTTINWGPALLIHLGKMHVIKHIVLPNRKINLNWPDHICDINIELIVRVAPDHTHICAINIELIVRVRPLFASSGWERGSQQLEHADGWARLPQRQLRADAAAWVGGEVSGRLSLHDGPSLFTHYSLSFNRINNLG